MADVGIRELKQPLSEYPDRAERGELLRVTERGRPKALLGPLPGRAQVEQRHGRRGVKPGSGAGLRPVPRVKSTGRVLDGLAEDRGE